MSDQLTTINQDVRLPSVALTQSEVLNVILAAARDPAVDPAKMSALNDLMDRMSAKQAEAEFNQDYMAMIREMPRIKKDGSVSYGEKKGGFKFATWENIHSEISPLLEKYGFALAFDSSPKEGGGATITGILLHKNGSSRKASIGLALDNSGGKNNIQGMGSTFSYGKRYVTTMLLNIVTEGEDDDGDRGGKSFIGVEQQCQINALIEKTATDLPRFLQFWGIAEVENIETRDFTRIMNALNSKVKK